MERDFVAPIATTRSKKPTASRLYWDAELNTDYLFDSITHCFPTKIETLHYGDRKNLNRKGRQHLS